MNENQIIGRVTKYFKKFFSQQFLKPEDKEFKELVKMVQMDEPGIIEMLLANPRIKKVEIQIEEKSFNARITSLGKFSGKLFWFESIYSKELILETGKFKKQVYETIIKDIETAEQTLIREGAAQC